MVLVNPGDSDAWRLRRAEVPPREKGERDRRSQVQCEPTQFVALLHKRPTREMKAPPTLPSREGRDSVARPCDARGHLGQSSGRVLQGAPLHPAGPL